MSIITVMSKLFAYILLAMALFGQTSAQAEVNIAVIAPREGDFSRFGEEIIYGVRTAVNDINRSGGLSGEKVNLITVDDRCDDNLAISTAQMIAVNVSEKDKVALVIGPYCPNELDTVTGIYAKAKVFQIIPMAVNTSRFEKHLPGLVLLAGDKNRQSADFYKYYVRHFNNQKVALIYDSNERDSIDTAAALQREFKNNGKLGLLQAYSYASYEDIDALSEEVLKDGIRIACVLGAPRQIGEISYELKSADKNFVIFIDKYAAQEDYARIMGDLADDTYYIGLPSLKDNPDFASTLVKLRLLGMEPEGLGVYGFSAVKLWAELVGKTGSFAYDDLAKALAEGPVSTTWGEVSFQRGIPAGTLNFNIYRHVDGQYTQAY